MKYILCILFALTLRVGFSQQKSIAGKYGSNDNYIILTDSTIKFKTQWGCGFRTTLYGYGSYKLQNNIIYYNPDEKENTLKPNYTIIQSRDSSSITRIKIKDNNEQIPYCTVYLREKRSDKLVNTFLADSNGIVVIENINGKHSEEIMVKPLLLGYGKVEIPLNEILGKSIVLDLSNAHDHYTADRTATFTIEEQGDSIQIIGPIFGQTHDLSKEEKKRKRKIITGTMVREWPWNWHFKDDHTPVPTIFVKQPKTI